MTYMGSAVVEAVAQSLAYAINNPPGHCAWKSSICQVTGANLGWHQQWYGAAGNWEEPTKAATVFDSSVIPPIGIDKYLLRLAATFKCSDSAFVAALVVVDRLLERDSGRLSLTMKNVHRLFLGSLVVTVKYHEDLVYANSHYAKAGGVHLRDVNRLERALLAALDFDLRVQPDQYRLYETMLFNSQTALRQFPHGSPNFVPASRRTEAPVADSAQLGSAPASAEPRSARGPRSCAAASVSAEGPPPQRPKSSARATARTVRAARSEPAEQKTGEEAPSAASAAT
eukprot:TRINITY_DN54709_c0_g1_i1.p1 TRINITY_DN54709_c0_g1~~TRINITY_DN54709_c0_g1_i1.p1  ORF type:complete len:285 (-),score=49.76 TRINITY_DN54709_c0_g1_i1:52-906(-)